jgi:hypothetical protein
MHSCSPIIQQEDLTEDLISDLAPYLTVDGEDDENDSDDERGAGPWEHDDRPYRNPYANTQGR